MGGEKVEAPSALVNSAESPKQRLAGVSRWTSPFRHPRHLGAILVVAGLLLVGSPTALLAQQGQGAAWLDSVPLELKPNDESTIVLANLSGDALDVQIDIVGATANLNLTVSPTSISLSGSGSADITVASSSTVGSATVVAWGKNTLATKQVSVVTGELTPVTSLPESLSRSARIDPFSDESAEVSLALPEAVEVPVESGCGAEGTGLAGRVAGPEGAIAAACSNGRSLLLEGIREPGTWAGKVDLLPSNPDAGSVSISVSARDTWPLPAYVLVVGLMLAYLFPLGGAWRTRLTLDHSTETALVRVRAMCAATRDFIANLEDDPEVGLDKVSDERAPLYLDRVAGMLRAHMAVAVDAAGRAPFLPPDGPEFKRLFGEVIPTVLYHYELLASSAELSARLRREIRDAFQSLPVGDAWMLNQALQLRVRPIADSAGWGPVRDAAIARDKNLRIFEGLWVRIQALPEAVVSMKDKEDLTRDLLQSHDDKALETVAGSVREKEAVDAKVEVAVSKPPAEPALEAQVSQTGRRLWIAWVILGLLIAVVVFIWNSTRPLSAAIAPQPGVALKDLYWPGLILLLIAMTFAIREISNRTLPRSTTEAGRRIRRLDFTIAVAGGSIVALSGFVSLYLQDSTFGGFADYFGIATWGITLGSGVSIAKRLLTSRTVEAT